MSRYARLLQLSVAGGMLLLIASSCTTTPLAQRPMTEQEQLWAEQMRRWHPGWKPPFRSPSRPVAAGAATTTFRQPAQRQIPAPTIPASLTLAGTETAEPAFDNEIIIVPYDSNGTVDSRQFYEVRKGDTLSRIARDFYGDPNAWRQIWDANRETLESPDNLLPGKQLIIPPRR
jgi:LysM repeat protein